MRLDECIGQVESSGDQRAMRFEPVTFQNKPTWVLNQIKLIQYAHGGFSKCDYDTALMIACTSWGEFQILGANIYAGAGFTQSIFAFCSVPLASIWQPRIFASFILARGFLPDEDLTEWSDDRFATFASFYNGPGAIAAYVQSMRTAIQNYHAAS